MIILTSLKDVMPLFLFLFHGWRGHTCCPHVMLLLCSWTISFVSSLIHWPLCLATRHDLIVHLMGDCSDYKPELTHGCTLSQSKQREFVRVPTKLSTTYIQNFLFTGICTYMCLLHQQ